MQAVQEHKITTDLQASKQSGRHAGSGLKTSSEQGSRETAPRVWGGQRAGLGGRTVIRVMMSWSRLQPAVSSVLVAEWRGDLVGDLRGERFAGWERARWCVGGEVLPGAVTFGVLKAEGECIYRKRVARTWEMGSKLKRDLLHERQTADRKTKLDRERERERDPDKTTWE